MGWVVSEQHIGEEEKDNSADNGKRRNKSSVKLMLIG